MSFSFLQLGRPRREPTRVLQSPNTKRRSENSGPEIARTALPSFPTQQPIPLPRPQQCHPVVCQTHTECHRCHRVAHFFSDMRLVYICYKSPFRPPNIHFGDVEATNYVLNCIKTSHKFASRCAMSCYDMLLPLKGGNHWKMYVCI